MDAHLPKLSMWLQWISSEKPGAGVTFRTVDLGAWRDIRPQWRVQSGRMRFQFQGPAGTRAFWVSSIETGTDSLAIHFTLPRGLARDPLYVCWAKDCALPVRDTIWIGAL